MEEGRIVSREPEVMSGELVFAGSRVQVKTLVDYLKAGHTGYVPGRLPERLPRAGRGLPGNDAGSHPARSPACRQRIAAVGTGVSSTCGSSWTKCGQAPEVKPPRGA